MKSRALSRDPLGDREMPSAEVSVRAQASHRNVTILSHLKFIFVLVRPFLSRYTKMEVFVTGANRTALESRLAGRDVVAILPIRFGKSLIQKYQPWVLIARFPVSGNEVKRSEV